MSVVCRETDTDSPENAESVCPVTSQCVIKQLDKNSTKVAEPLAFEFIVLPAIYNDQGAIIVTVRKNRPHTRRRFLNRWTRQITRLARNLKYRKFRHNSRTASRSYRKGEEIVDKSKPNHLHHSTYQPLSSAKRNESRKQIIVSLSWHGGVDSRDKKPISGGIQSQQRGNCLVDATTRVKKTCSAIVISTATKRLSRHVGLGVNLGAVIKERIDYCKADTDVDYSSGDCAADPCVGYLKGANTVDFNPSFIASVSVSNFTPWDLIKGDDCLQLSSNNTKLPSNIASLVVTYDMEDAQKKTVGEAGHSKQRKDHANLYDPIYDFACDFAESHGYGFVVFVDDETKPQNKGVRRKRLRSKTAPSRSFLPHVPMERDRRWPVHVVKYTSHSYETRRRKCQVRECVLNHMNLTQSAKKDGDIKKSIRKDRVTIDAKLLTPERSASVSSKKPQKRRSSSKGSQFPGPSGMSPTRPSSSSATKLCRARLSSNPDAIDGMLGSHKKLGSPDRKYTPESLATYRERLKQCSKMYEQLMDDNGSIHSDINPRKSAEGDATVMDVNDQGKMPEKMKATASKLRPANHKLKAKQKESPTSYFSVDGNEENLSRNHALEDENIDTTKDGGELLANVTSSLPRLCDKTSKQYKLYNSISATIFRESQLAHRNCGESENLEKLPLAKIDFVRVKDNTVKKKISGIHVSQEIYHAVRHHFQNIPRKMKPVYGVLHGQSLGRVRCSQHLTSGSVQIHAAAINSDIFRHTRDGEKSESCPNPSLRQMHCDRGLKEHQHKQSPIVENSSVVTIGDSQFGRETNNEAINETMTPAWGDCITVDFNDFVENSGVKTSEKEMAGKAFEGDPYSLYFKTSASHKNHTTVLSVSPNSLSMEYKSAETSPVKCTSLQNLSIPTDLMTYLDNQTDVSKNKRCDEESEEVGECSYSYDVQFKEAQLECDNVNNNALPDKSSQCELHLEDSQLAQEGTSGPSTRTLTTSPISAGQGEDTQAPKLVNFAPGKNMDEYLRLPVLPQRSKSTTKNGNRSKANSDTRDSVAQIPPVPRSSCITKNPSPLKTKNTARKEPGEIDFGQTPLFSSEHSGSAESWMSGIFGKHNKKKPPRLSCKISQHPFGNINAQGDNLLKEKRLFGSVLKFDAYNQLKFKNTSSLVCTPRNLEGGDDHMQIAAQAKNEHQETVEPNHSDLVFLLPIEEHKSLIAVKQCTGKRGADEGPASVHCPNFAPKQKPNSKPSHFSSARPCQDDKLTTHSPELKDDGLFPSLTNDSENNNNNALDNDNSSSQVANSHREGGTHSHFSFATSMQKSKSYLLLCDGHRSVNQNSNASSSKTNTTSNSHSNSSNSASSTDSVSEQSFEQALDRELQMLLESQSCRRRRQDGSSPISACCVPDANTSHVTKRAGRYHCSENSRRAVYETRSRTNARERSRCSRKLSGHVSANEGQVTLPLGNTSATETNRQRENVPVISDSTAEHPIPTTAPSNGEQTAFSRRPSYTFTTIQQKYRDPQMNDQSVELCENHKHCKTPWTTDSVPYCPTTENYWETAGREPLTKIYVPENNRQSCSHAQNNGPLPYGCLNRQLSNSIKNWRLPAAFMEQTQNLAPEALHPSANKSSTNITSPQNTQNEQELNQPMDTQLLRSQDSICHRLEEVTRNFQDGLQSLQCLVEKKFNRMCSLLRTSSPKTVGSEKDESPKEPDAIRLNTQKARPRGVNRELPLNVSKYNNDKKWQLTNSTRDDEHGVGGEAVSVNQDRQSMSGRSDTTFPTIQFYEVKTSNYNPTVFDYDIASFGRSSPPNVRLSQETVNSQGSGHVKTNAARSSRRSAVIKSNSRGIQRGIRMARKRSKGSRRVRSSSSTYKSIRMWKDEINNPIKKHCCKGINGNSRYQRAQSRVCRRRHMADRTCCNICLTQPSWLDYANNQQRSQRHRARRPRMKSRSTRHGSGKRRVRTRKKRRGKAVRFHTNPPTSRRKRKKLRSPELYYCNRQACRKTCSAYMYKIRNQSALSQSSRNRSANNLNRSPRVNNICRLTRLTTFSSNTCSSISLCSERTRKSTKYVIAPKGHEVLNEIMKRRNAHFFGNVLRIGQERAKQRSNFEVDEIVRRFRRIISQFPNKRLRGLEELIIGKERINRQTQSRLLSELSPARPHKVLRQTPKNTTTATSTRRAAADMRRSRVEPSQPHPSSADPALTCSNGPLWDDGSLVDGASDLDPVPVNEVFRRPGLYFFNTTADDDGTLDDLGHVREVSSPIPLQTGPVDSISLIRRNLSKNKNASRNAGRQATYKLRDFSLIDFANREAQKFSLFNRISSGHMSDEDRDDDLWASSRHTSTSRFTFDPGQDRHAVYLNPLLGLGLNATSQIAFLEGMDFVEQYQSRQNSYSRSSDTSEVYSSVVPEVSNDNVTSDIASHQNDMPFLIETDVVGELKEMNASEHSRSMISFLNFFTQAANNFLRTDPITDFIVDERNRELSAILSQRNHDVNVSRASTIKGDNKCPSLINPTVVSNVQEASVRSLSVISEKSTDVIEVNSTDKRRIEDKSSQAARSGPQSSCQQAPASAGPGQLGRVSKTPHFTSSLWKGFERAEEGDLPSGKQVIDQHSPARSCFKVPVGRPVTEKRKSNLSVAPGGLHDNPRQCSDSKNHKVLNSSPDIAEQDGNWERYLGVEESNQLSSRGKESLIASAASTTQQQMTSNLLEGLGETRLPPNIEYSAISVYRDSQNKCFNLVDNRLNEYVPNFVSTSALPDTMTDLEPGPSSNIIASNGSPSGHMHEADNKVNTDMLFPQPQQTHTNGSDKTRPLVISSETVFVPEKENEHPFYLESPTAPREEHSESLIEERFDESQPRQHNAIGNQRAKLSKVSGGCQEFRVVRCHTENNLISHKEDVCNQRNTSGTTGLQWETQYSMIVRTPGISTTWHCTVPQEDVPLTHPIIYEGETKPSGVNAPKKSGPRPENFPEAHCSSRRDDDMIVRRNTRGVIEESESASQVHPGLDQSKENNNNAIKPHLSLKPVMPLENHPLVTTAGQRSHFHRNTQQFGLHANEINFRSMPSEQHPFKINTTRNSRKALPGQNMTEAPRQGPCPWRKRCADSSLPVKMGPPIKVPRLSPKIVLSQFLTTRREKITMRRARFALMKELRYMKERQEKRLRYKQHHGTAAPMSKSSCFPSEPSDADSEAST